MARWHYINNDQENGHRIQNSWQIESTNNTERQKTSIPPPTPKKKKDRKRDSEKICVEKIMTKNE